MLRSINTPIVMLVISILLSRFASADDFTNPPSTANQGGLTVQVLDGATTFYVGTQYHITWDSPIKTISLALRRYGAGDNEVVKFLDGVANVGYYDWTIGANDGITTQLLSITNTFALLLGDPTGQSNSTWPVGWVNRILTSRGFKIQNNTNTNVIPSITSSTAPSGSPTDTLLSSTNTNSASPSATAIPASTGLSNGAKAGIAIGAILFWVITIAAAIICYKLWRKPKEEVTEVTEQNSQDTPIDYGTYSTYNNLPKYRQSRLMELSGESYEPPKPELSA